MKRLLFSPRIIYHNQWGVDTTPHYYLFFMFIIDDILIIGGAALIGGAAGSVAGALISFVIDVFIDEDSIGNEVQIRYPDALKLLIQEKKSSAIKIGIFGENDREIENSVEISSSQGISDHLYVGQEIYL